MSHSTNKTSHPYLKLRHLWLSLLMLLVGTNSTFAQNVAKVGTTEYATIEEAVAAWGPGKTLTLLANVTTTSTVIVEVNATKSTQNWTLDLGDYTWTASSCNAFQLYAAGGTVMNQNYGLKIYANQNGGITASGKYCIECKYDNSTAGYRPRLEIHGGTYSGSNIIYYASLTYNSNNVSNGPSTHIFKSNDGTEPVFNGNFALAKCPLTIYAGYFNGTSFNTYPVSSTANTNLNGGHFKTINAFPSASNNKGIVYGNYKVFVKSDASIDVVNGAPATYEAKATKTLLLSSNQSVNYSDYVYYEKADDAIKKYSSGTIEIILSENVTATEDKSFRSGTLTIDTSAEGSDYTGNITLTSTSAKFIIKFPEGKGHYGVTASTGRLHVTESVADGIVTRTYSVQNVSNPEATVGETGYSTVYDAFYAIDGTTANKTIVLQKDVTNAGIVTNGTATGGDGKTVATFDLNGKSIGVTSVAAGNNADYTLTIIDSSQDKTGVVTNTDASLFIIALTGINDYSGTYTLKIQAGTWQFDPSNVVINGETHNLVDEGYVAHDNGNGTWTVGEATYVAQIGTKKYVTLQAAVDAAQQMGGEVTVNIINDIAGETVTVKEVANFKLTIDGKKDDSSNYTVDAVIVVDGLRGNGGSTTNGASVTIQNIAFVKTTSTDGIQASHYPHHLTIQDCTYSGSDNDKWFLNASVDGPLYGVTVKNVTVEHARLIYANMADDAEFQNITATTDVKVGFNVKTSGTALIENCQVTTGKYAFRDYSDAYEGTFTLKDNTFISTSTAGDEGVIVNRGGAVGTAHINVESGTYTGSIKVLNNKEGVLAISGGYFSEEFPQEYIAADLVAQGKVCAPATDKEGYYTVGDPHYVAQIGEVKYVSLATAVAAVPTDGTETTIVMIDDETVIGNSGVTIATTQNVKLDLNGKTVTLSVTESKGSQLITNRGTLTITDSSEGQNGKLTNVADESLAVGSWPTNNYVTNVITNSGTLNMEAGNIISTANGSICYAIDNNSTSYDAILNINGGYLTSVGTVIRQFCNSTTKQNVINMTGGVVTTNGYAAIWTQLPGSSASSKKLATLNISGGEITASSYAWYDYSYGDSFEAVEYNISGGKFTGGIFSYALRDGIISGFISGGLFSPAPSSSYIKPAGYMFVPSEEVEGYYVLGLAEVDYSWTENGVEYHDYLAFNTPFKNNYLMDGETITLLQDITLTEDLTWNTEGDATFTLNLGEFKITKGNFSIKLVPGQRVNTDKTTSISIFTSAEEGYVVKSAKDENGKYYYTVEEAEVMYTATNGTVKYMLYSSTMVSSDGTYKLLKDVTATTRIAPGVMASNVTLDLNGHTLTSTATDCAILLSRAGTSSKPKTFNLIDSSDEKGGMLKVNPDVNNGIEVSGKYNQVTIGEGVTIDGDCVALLSENQTLTVNGTINGGNDFAVATNGSTTKNANITINEGAVLTSNVTAMYLPGTGTTTISGGTITGSNGIYVKSGELNITGGEITGNGETAEFVHNPSGTSIVGAGLVVENCSYPGGAPIVNVTGGTFTSANADAIASYSYGDGNEPIGQFVHGGYFSTELDRDICEEGKKTVPSTVKEGYYELGDIVYVAQIGDVKYESLADAVAAVPTDGTETTITMIANEMIDVVGYAITIPATKNIVLDLNGFEVVGTATAGNTSALITNRGTLTIKDSSDTNADGTGTGKLMSGATPTWTWDGTDDYSGSYASNLIRNEKNLIVESGNLYNMSTGSAAYAIDNYSAGNVTINGGKVDAAKASAIRMFYVNGGSISVTDGVIGRYVSDDDYTYMGVQVMGGTNVDVSVSGGTISGMYALYSNASGGNTSLSGGTYDGYVGFAASVPNISITDGRYGEWVGTWGDQVKFISGGVYAETITEEYIADGYVATENLDPATKAEYPYTVAPKADQEFVLIDGEPYQYAVLGNIYASKVTYKRSFRSNQVNKYMPWYLPVDYTITGEENADFYKIDFIAAATETGVIEDASKVYIFTMKMSNGEVLKANRPYFIIPKSAGNYEFVSEDVTLYKRIEEPDSRLHLEKSTINYDFYGNYETKYAEAEYEWLMMSGGRICWTDGPGADLGSYRWYIKPSSKLNEDYDYTKIRIDIAGDEDVVGISTQVVDDSEIEGYYSVNGTKLAVPVQGTNIVKYKNGMTKKIFIK